jgi:hypothetical protein
MQRGRWRLAAAVVVAALALGACGGSQSATKNTQPAKPTDNGVAAKSGQNILKAATAGFRSATSVHVIGRLKEQGDTVTLDLRLGQTTAQGSVTIGGAKLRILRAGRRLYLRGRGFWEKAAGAQVANLVGERWVLAPESGSGGQAFAGLVRFTLVSGFADEVLTLKGTATKGGTGTVDGKPAVAVKSSEGDSLWVATSGTPYPLRLEPSQPDAGERLDLREYNAPVPVTTPPADALDLDKLQQGG